MGWCNCWVGVVVGVIVCLFEVGSVVVGSGCYWYVWCGELILM